MPYLALILDADPWPIGALQAFAQEPQVRAFELGREPLLLNAGGAAIARTHAVSCRGLLWIEARDLNDALRIAQRCCPAERSLLQLHSLQALIP